MLRIYSGSNKVEIIGDDNGVQLISFGEYNIPTNLDGSLLINFRVIAKHFRYISASDILSGDFDPNEIKNKFVLVGTSALGLLDLRSTPFDSASQE